MLFLGKPNIDNRIMNALNHSQAVIHFDMLGNILWANSNFLTTLGYSLEEIKGRHHSMFVDKGYAASETYQRFWHELQQGKFQSAQYKRFGKGGKEIYIEATYNPVMGAGGKLERVVKFATDVTVKTLKMQESLNRTQAVIHFEMNGTIIDANEKFLTTTGYALAEIKGKHHRMFMPAAEAATEEYARFWQKLGQGEFQAGEFRRVGKGGKEIWLRASYNPVFGNDGKPYQVVKYASDITSQKEMGLQANVAISAVASATHELSGSIGDIARSMGNTRDSVSTVASETEIVSNQVESMVKAAQNMGSLVQLIENIADQTKLLALNAAIEAARAGEGGRGFSVVADEVKKLANQTGQSTARIVEDIRGIQEISKNISKRLENIQSMVGQALDGTNNVVAATEEQSAVTSEISSNMVKVSQLVNTDA